MVPDRLPYPGPVERIHLVPVLRPPLIGPSATSPPLVGARGSCWRFRGRASRTLSFAVRTVPCSRGDLIQIDTIDVGGNIAAIAQEKDILVVGLSADDARLRVDVLFGIFDDHCRVDLSHLDTILNGIGGSDGAYQSHAGVSYEIQTKKKRQDETRVDVPPGRSLNSTMLKLRRHIGQLLARSTHGFRQSLCRICPQGSNWAIWPGSSSPSLATSGSLALSPRSPKQTIQVSDMDGNKVKV